MQIQGVTLPRVQFIRRVSSERVNLKTLPGRGTQYDRQTSDNGEAWDVQGLIDHVGLDQLLALLGNGVVRVVDPDRGSFHAILQADGSWSADDPATLQHYDLKLLVKETVFNPAVFNPNVYA